MTDIQICIILLTGEPVYIRKVANTFFLFVYDFALVISNDSMIRNVGM